MRGARARLRASRRNRGRVLSRVARTVRTRGAPHLRDQDSFVQYRSTLLFSFSSLAAPKQECVGPHALVYAERLASPRRRGDARNGSARWAASTPLIAAVNLAPSEGISVSTKTPGSVASATSSADGSGVVSTIGIRFVCGSAFIARHNERQSFRVCESNPATMIL